MSDMSDEDLHYYTDEPDGSARLRSMAREILRRRAEVSSLEQALVIAKDGLAEFVAEREVRQIEQAAGREHVERVVMKVLGDIRPWSTADLARRVADRLCVSPQSFRVAVASAADELPVNDEAQRVVDEMMAAGQQGPSRKLSVPALSEEEVAAVRRHVKEQRESWGGDPDVNIVTDVLDRLIAEVKL
jgi:hypothetical protein